MLRTTITFSQDEIDNIIELFELEFLPLNKHDNGVENLHRLFSMGSAYHKLEAARRRLAAKDPRNGQTAWR